MATKRKVTTAVSYLRVSGKGQVKGDGFPRQREAIEKHAKAMGYKVVDEYRDEGVSGTKELADRDGLAALLDRIESNGVRVVLIERADRLARDLMVSELLLSQFRDLGVKVIAADSGTDLTVGDDDPTRKLIRQVLGAVSEFEKSIIVGKLRAARERVKKRDGRCEGKKPYGYYEGEPEALERMKELKRQRPGGKRTLSYAKVATLMNEEGLVARSGGAWNASSVYDILKREGVRS